VVKATQLLVEWEEEVLEPLLIEGGKGVRCNAVVLILSTILTII
jgi:hypothetical protein